MSNNSSMNRPSSNFTDSTGRSFALPYSVQSGDVFHGFPHNGTYQGINTMHGSFNVPNMAGALPARNSTMNIAPLAGMQQSTGNLAGRYGSNLPVALSQISHDGSHGHSGITNRGTMNSIRNPVYDNSTNYVGGSMHGVLHTSGAIGNGGAVPSFGASTFLGNAGSQITNSMGNAVGSGSGYLGRDPGGDLSLPGIGSRLDMGINSGLQANRLMSGGLQQQVSQHVLPMLGNSYASVGGPLSQSHSQSINNLNSMAMLNDVNFNDKLPFGVGDFPTLGSRPKFANSAGGAHGQIGSMRRQGIDGPTTQNQEFSIQNEDFPALPGAKGGNADYSMDFLQKDQLRDGSVPMMQTQHFSMGRSAGPGFTDGVYPSSRPQQHQQSMPSFSGDTESFLPLNNKGRPHLQGSDLNPSSNTMHHIQHNGPIDKGMRSMNNFSAMSSSDQQMQQYQQQNPSSFHLRQMSTVDPLFHDQGVNSIQAAIAIDQSFRDQGINSIQAAHAINQSFRDQGVSSIQAAHAMDQSFRDQGVHSIQDAHAIDHSFRDQGVNSIQAAHAIDQSFCDQGVNSFQAAHAIDQSFRDQGLNSIQAAHAIDQPFCDQGVNSVQAAHAIDPLYHDRGVNSIQATHSAADPYSMLGLLSVIRKDNPGRTHLALGIDLTSLGLNLSSSEDLHETFSSPWSDLSVEGPPEFVLPQCYNEKPPPALNKNYFMKFDLKTLFYIFYTMPKDEAQLCAANELCKRGWFYHKELQTWFSRIPDKEPLVKTSTYERGSYKVFDILTWEHKQKENFVLQYGLVNVNSQG